ncbi:hypothetical protein [Streptomyces sp. NPDC058954]|uniref:hypothetical protein n=1 Tax=Streptomyces sp. NPDC058954 TaxID=3346677 RepID=UPI0036ABB40C
MAIGTCVVCGSDGPIQLHHVAGRRNDADYVVSVCAACHEKTLTVWQWVHRIPLEDDETKTDLVAPWATSLGALHVIEALGTRIGFPEFAEAVRSLETIVRFMAGIPVTENIPIPNVPKGRQESFSFFRGGGATQVVSVLATMIAYLSEVTTGSQSVTTRFLREIAGNPSEFVSWCDDREGELKKWAAEAGSDILRSIQEFSESMDVWAIAAVFKRYLDEFEKISAEYLESVK